MADAAEFRQLLARLLDGELNDAQFAALADALRADESARALYLQQTIVASQLERLHCTLDVTRAGARVGWGRTMVRWAGLSMVKSYAVMRLNPVVSCAAALVVIVGLIAVLSVLTVPTHTFVRGPSAGATIVANLVGASSAQWDDGQVGTHRGAHLLAGHVLRLKSGRAELRFKRGARAVLRGPAQLILESDNSARLLEGKLAAHVPNEARGFLVDLPGGRIVDLGTEFAVAVDARGDADIHVFQGAVELAPEDAASATVLRRGESRRMSFQFGRYVLGDSKASPLAIAGLRKLVEPLPEASMKLTPTVDMYVQCLMPDEQVSDAPQLLVKHNPQDPNYERESWLTFDLAALPAKSIQGARLVLTLDVSPANLAGAERETRACRFGVYGVTDPSLAIDELTWSRSRQVPRQLLGMFQVRGRGERGAQVAVGGGALTAWLQSLGTGRATLAIVRHDPMNSTVHAFASSEHPELAPPELEIWHEVQTTAAGRFDAQPEDLPP